MNYASVSARVISKPGPLRGKAAWSARLCGALVIVLLLATISAGRPSQLEEHFQNPPLNAQLRAYWWWLNGNVSKEAITRDLEEMKKKGFGGALICDAGGA